jgi:SM-20-related protein
MHERISVIEDFVDAQLQKRISALVGSPIWQYGWKSTREGSRFAYWHSHFAGSDQGRQSCEAELAAEPLLAPIYELWKALEARVLQGHEPLRVYANAHTYGVEGSVHVDDTDAENYFSTVYYAHPAWSHQWAGDTVFYSDDGQDIVRSIHPKPGRAVTFPGAIPHCARAPSRDCNELRITIVVKTQRKAGHAEGT